MSHYGQEDQVPVPGTRSHSEARLGDCSALGGRFAFGRDGILNLILGPALTPNAKRSIYRKRPKDSRPRSLWNDLHDEPHSLSVRPCANCLAHRSASHMAQPMLLRSLWTAWEWISVPDMISD